MELTITKQGNGIRAKLSGQFTFTDNQKFKDILSYADQDGIGFIELDFADVDFIDSAGLGMLLLLRDTTQNRHIPVSIHAIRGQVEKIFHITKFNQLFTVHS